MIKRAMPAILFVIAAYFLLHEVFGLSGQRSIIIGLGIPLYALCAGLCIEGWRRYRDPLFLWQGGHLACLCFSQIFFTAWYWMSRPPLLLDIQFHLPNLINIGMGIGALMWCWHAFQKKQGGP